MGETTNIGWTKGTWNPWIGCHEVSPGCAHCYAKVLETRFGRDFGTLRRTKTMEDPLKWVKPSLIFTCSMSDFFHEAADRWRHLAWEVIRNTPRHTYQILTKRIERVPEFLPDDWGEGYKNVWLGVSVENQRFMYRARDLREIPAALRFVSAEPLLSGVDFTRAPRAGEKIDWSDTVNVLKGKNRIEWVIVGGESQAGARIMDPNWARFVQMQCAHNGTAFFLKQLGGHPNPRAHEEALLNGKLYTEMPQWPRL